MNDKQDSVSLKKNRDKLRVLDLANIAPLQSAKKTEISPKFDLKSPNPKSATPSRDTRHNFMEYESGHPKKGTRLNFSPYVAKTNHIRSSDTKRKIEESNKKYRVGGGIIKSPKAKSLARRFVTFGD